MRNLWWKVYNLDKRWGLLCGIGYGGWFLTESRYRGIGPWVFVGQFLPTSSAAWVYKCPVPMFALLNLLCLLDRFCFNFHCVSLRPQPNKVFDFGWH